MAFGERVFDAFYVQRNEGDKLLDPEAIHGLKVALRAILSADDLSAPETPARVLARAPAVDSF